MVDRQPSYPMSSSDLRHYTSPFMGAAKGSLTKKETDVDNDPLRGTCNKKRDVIRVSGKESAPYKQMEHLCRSTVSERRMGLFRRENITVFW